MTSPKTDAEPTARSLSRILRGIAYSDRASGLLMMACAALGLLLMNIPLTAAPLHHFSEISVGIPWTNIVLPISEWAQDGLLTVFFLVVGLDLKQELTTGSLANPRKAAVPMLAAVGGMIAPPLVFLAVTGIFHANGAVPDFSVIERGWAVPTATDIAFSLAVLALFARGLPGAIRAFLMTLATVDDLLGILLIAVLFSSFGQWYWFVGLVACAVAWYFLCRLRKVPWVLVGALGLLTWVMMFEAGIHPTLSGVLVGLLTPSREMHGEATPRAERYHDRLVPVSALIALPIFAFFATGISLHGMSVAVLASPLVLGLVLALVVGKPLGIMAVSWAAVHFGRLKLADGLRVRDLIGLACACGIGFTVSFLIASLAFNGSIFTGEARLAVLLGSLISAAIAGIVFSWQSRVFASRRNLQQ
ncbi:MAG: Na+/H+ antiporter NhaA [Bifidobacteriaceae bacterium]|jgi:NhaA family Na+:H+ antiporter|nr:Na+/H+ antiporter NhaA [Bifidobacteriaceae bacterium]